ncbi:Nramp family divalent metal transporter [soil metagenome]
MSDRPNPYSRDPAAVLEPPTTLRGSLRFLGPGFVLSASIVGSGELIATTVLGAQAGFVTLWVILVSCLVKVTVQLEFGKHAINTGETTMEAFNRLPGPRFGKARTHWTIWGWLIIMIVKLAQVGAIVGTVAVIAQMVVPALPLWAWVFLTAVTVSLLVFRGYYSFIEGSTLIMTGLFTVFTLASVVALQFTPLAFSFDDVVGGLRFHLPPELVFVAAAAFGLTGVGGDEIMAYTYWLIEKGYASHVGPRDGSKAWERRAKGWIRVMYFDALLSMCVYTIVTAAFYVLGATVLYARGEIPEGSGLVAALANMYTDTLGPWAETVFLAGAFVVLFSTLFAALAAWTRMFSDAFAKLGWFDYSDQKQRRRAIAIFSWFFPMAWGVAYLTFEAPQAMIKFGGVATSIILVVVVFAALHFRYRRLEPRLKPTAAYDAALWVSAVAIVAIGLYGVVAVLGMGG